MKSIKTYEEFDFKNIFGKKETPISRYDKITIQRMDQELIRSIEECFMDLQDYGFFIKVAYQAYKDDDSPSFEIQIVKDKTYSNKVYFSATKNYGEVEKFKVNEIMDTLLESFTYLKEEFDLTISNIKIDEYDHENNDKKETSVKSLMTLARSQVNNDILSLKIYFKRK